MTLRKITKLIALDIPVTAAYPAETAKATATLTSDATAPEDASTVTLGTRVYTYKATLSTGPTVPYEVLIGISADTALDNIKSAVNGTAGAGTTYSTGTSAHPLLSATTNTATTQLFEARAEGSAGNAIATTETSTHLAFGSTHMTQLEVDKSELASIAGGDQNQVLFTLANVTNTSAVITVQAQELISYTDSSGVEQVGYVPLFECLAPSSSKAMIPYERTFTGQADYSILLPKVNSDRVRLLMKADAAVKLDLYETVSLNP